MTIYVKPSSLCGIVRLSDVFEESHLETDRASCVESTLCASVVSLSLDNTLSILIMDLHLYY